MFDIVRNNPRYVQLFLLLITLPFAFWGVESYVRNIGTGADVAKVGDSKITPQELQQAVMAQQERMRSALGRQFNAAMFETPEARRAVLDGLINQRVMALYAAKTRIGVSDIQLQQFIAAIPALQVDGKFSPERYETLVAGQGMSREGFEARVRQDLALQMTAGAVASTAIVPRVSSNRWLAAQLEEREISDVTLKPEQYADQAKIGDDAVKSYYEANSQVFQISAQLRADFLVLSQDALAAQIAVSDDDVKKAYAERSDRYKQGEERRASHILIHADKGAPAAEVDAARKKAEDILARVRKTPADFAKLAKENSQDPGSAEKGGDLGWFGHGTMVKPFEDAAFSLKENEISDVVRTDFGFHVIRVIGIKAEHAKPLTEVRDEIVADLKRLAAAKKYAEIAEGFSNLVYEQADSLKPAADKYGLTLQQGPWLGKGVPAQGPLGNAKLNAALFSDDAIKNKRNTEAVEVAPNTLVAARVAEFKPASVIPLEAVKGDIRKQLIREEAAKLAHRDGEARLAQLAKGEAVTLAWSPARTVQRLGIQGMSPTAVAAIFKADAAKLPAYAGAAMPDGSYAIYRIGKVAPYAPGDKENPRAEQLRQQYGALLLEEEFGGWTASLRRRYEVSINKAALETKER